ncbi:amidase [Iamia sp. SCSIO 61187]|uniref:amidase n=1 Tax=Iamia sp. SCSIO 61187 TaxID=2722752 RepID=UPI001C638905|nr:amidase [Iamia sp. SCSIO 61187]QYG91970.1 amidase [Iamia sp. SCSIO 61187]
MADLTDLDATAQADLVRSGEVSPSELVRAAVERAEATSDLNAIIHPRYQEAIDEAGGDLPDGPFRGVPFVLKDLDGMAAGLPLHMGTKALRDAGYVAPSDDTLAARFRAAGLVVIGKTNTPELGLVPSTEPESYGPTRNPWDTTRTPGGSSGGSAAAVAAGVVPMGHAGDGGGSIRIPAAFCGLVGLKPGRGRVTLGPDVGESWAGLVSRLAVTRSVRDTAALLDAVAGPDVGDPYWAPPPARPFRDEVGADPGSLRIGWTSQSPDEATTTDPEVAAATEAVARQLAELGHKVEEASPPALADPAASDHFLTCFGVWTARDLDQIGDLLGTPVTEDGVEPGTWAVAEMGRSITGAQYLAGVEGLHTHARRIVRWWDEWDLLLTPTVPELPPTLGQFAATPDNPLVGLIRSASIVSLTAPFNITGQPAISLPLGRSADGLPIGQQLVAAPAREDVLLRVAAQLEEAHPWAERRPPV